MIRTKKTYEVLKDLTEDPAGYIAEKVYEGVAKVMKFWADDWAKRYPDCKMAEGERRKASLQRESGIFLKKSLHFRKK